MSTAKKVIKAVTNILEDEQFQIDARDFLSAQERRGSEGTKIAQLSTSLVEAAQILNQTVAQQKKDGGYTNIISPVVIPKDQRSLIGTGVLAIFLIFIGLAGIFLLPLFGLESLRLAIFGPHYWIIAAGFVVVDAFKNSYVSIPDGCQALITQYGKVVETVGPGRKVLLHPLKKVGYIVNTTREYPYNAPIREAVTQEGVEASVDLFLQFKIEEPSEFIFRLGGSHGFSEKLQNAVSEVTRSLIYEQKAEAIYDLVGESTQKMLDNLNKQFLPSVRFVNANITHAEPSSQEYRMDLAAAEVLKLAKDAYNYQYELNLRKELDEGELNKELASLHEKLSVIKAEIATHQAQIDTAMEKAINRANAQTHQMLVEAESEANANAALFNAQSLDIKAINSARYPEILEYRYQQEILDRIEAIADKLPQVVNIGEAGKNDIDYMAVAKKMMGLNNAQLYSPEDIQKMRQRVNEIRTRIQERNKQISNLTPIEEQ